jgi:hypothetical protein
MIPANSRYFLELLRILSYHGNWEVLIRKWLCLFHFASCEFTGSGWRIGWAGYFSFPHFLHPTRETNSYRQWQDAREVTCVGVELTSNCGMLVPRFYDTISWSSSTSSGTFRRYLKLDGSRYSNHARGWAIRNLIPLEAKGGSFLQNWLSCPLNFLYNMYQCLFTDGQAAGTWVWPLISYNRGPSACRCGVVRHWLLFCLYHWLVNGRFLPHLFQFFLLNFLWSCLL